jgi:integrase
VRRSNFRHGVWLPIQRDAKLGQLRFHDLRHTSAALALAAGAHPKASQAPLGHATITTTLNTYGHLFEGLDSAIADRFDEMKLRGLDTASQAPKLRAVGDDGEENNS